MVPKPSIYDGGGKVCRLYDAEIHSPMLFPEMGASFVKRRSPNSGKDGRDTSPLPSKKTISTADGMKPVTLAQMKVSVKSICDCINFRFRDVTNCIDYLAVNSREWDWIEGTVLRKVCAIILDEYCSSQVSLNAVEPKYTLLSTKEELQYAKSISQTMLLTALKESYKKDVDLKKKSESHAPVYA